MRHYEYKIVELAGGMWSRAAARQDAFLEVANREGRTGWRVVVTHQPGQVTWNSVLLERQVD